MVQMIEPHSQRVRVGMSGWEERSKQLKAEKYVCLAKSLSSQIKSKLNI